MMVIKQKTEAIRLQRILGITKPSPGCNRFWWLLSTKVELSFVLFNKHINRKYHSSALHILNHSYGNRIHQHYCDLHRTHEKTEAPKYLATCQGHRVSKWQSSNLNTVLEFSL